MRARNGEGCGTCKNGSTGVSSFPAGSLANEAGRENHVILKASCLIIFLNINHNF